MGFQVSLESVALTQQAPPGVHPAVCVAIIDIGTHKTNFKGKLRDTHKVVFIWELPDCATSGTESQLQFAVKEYTLSLANGSNLRGDIESRRGSKLPDIGDFDLLTELGTSCMINMVQEEQYTNIGSIMPLYRTTQPPKAHVEPYSFTLEDWSGPSDTNFPKWLPHVFGKSVRSKVMMSHELTGSMGSQSTSNGSQNIPF